MSGTHLASEGVSGEHHHAIHQDLANGSEPEHERNNRGISSAVGGQKE